MRFPVATTPAYVQTNIASAVLDSLKGELARHTLDLGRHGVPLLAGLLWGVAQRVGWTTTELLQYLNTAFAQMEKDRALLSKISQG